jgi:glycerate kinase
MRAVALQVLVAPQAFKGCADAYEVAAAIGEGLARVWPDARIDLAPVADGGEGTVRALVEARHGTYRTAHVHDPLRRPIAARWGLIDNETAVIEMAAASGLPLLQRHERDPLRTGTFGTGELIKEAVASGARRILVGIGGSATNDAGAGMLRALGLRLLDARGDELAEGGAALAALDRIEGEIDPAVRRTQVLVASDVRNPLCGPEGASAVFGPQKGATPDDVALLDAALGRFADVAAVRAGTDRRDVPGAGAAGGIGFALMTFLNAQIRPGAELVLDAGRFDERLRGTHLCVTGEGRLDAQSLYGKATITVAKRAAARRVPTAAIVGSLGDGYEGAWAAGLAAVEPISTGPADLETLISQWRPLVCAAAERLARAVQLGRGIVNV